MVVANSNSRPVVGIGTVVLRNRALGIEVLLIRRSKPPREGQWSIPGGRQEWGETARHGAAREVKEETGLEVDILGLIDVIDSLTEGPDGLSYHYTLIDFAARPVGGCCRPVPTPPRCVGFPSPT